MDGVALSECSPHACSAVRNSLNRWPHAGTRGQVNHQFRLRVLEHFAHPLGIANVRLHELEGTVCAHFIQIGSLPAWRVEGIETVDDSQREAAVQKRLGNVGTDEAGSPRHQDPSHGWRCPHEFISVTDGFAQASRGSIGSWCPLRRRQRILTRAPGVRASPFSITPMCSRISIHTSE